MTTDKITRRSLGGLAAAGVSLPLLAACGSDAPDKVADAGGSGDGAAGPSSGTALGASSDVEVGGGEILADQQVVVTQPTSGSFKCFTAVCSHQGCIVSSVSDGTINCDCHGSQYSIKDGSVVTGPATFPLAEIPIQVSGSEITVS
jgi:Rieske Fe-S protein